MDNEIIEFLRESNAIENVFDEDSLKQAIKAWQYIIKQNKLTIKNILETHRLLMINHDLDEEEIGHFRKRPVWIGGHQAKSWWAINVLMENWIKDVERTLRVGFVQDKTAAEWIQDDHILYEAIHPFIDGNGRTGRIFLNWERVQKGLPILIIKNDEKNKYYEWFQ